MDEFRDPYAKVAAVGLVVSPQSGTAITKNALVSLQVSVDSDPETAAAKIARKTLERGAFHARDDGHLARHVLATAIGNSAPFAFHLAASPFVEGLSFARMVRPLAMQAAFVASDHREQCTVHVPQGPIADSEDAAKVLMETASREAAVLHANPPAGRNARERIAFQATNARPFRRNFRVEFVNALHPLVQIADLVLWAHRPSSFSEGHARIAELMRSRRGLEVDRDGIIVRGFSLGGG